MKSIIYFILFFSISYAIQAQENINEQNPNHKRSYEKYIKKSSEILASQGTTSQETYVAIDPIEEKRVRKKTRKDLRAKRALWRHQERMERAKNGQYYDYYSPRSYFSNYMNPLLTIGLASCILF